MTHHRGRHLTRIVCKSLSFCRSSFSRSATFIMVSFSTSRSFSVTWERRARKQQRGMRDVRDEGLIDNRGISAEIHSLSLSALTHTLWASSRKYDLYQAAWHSRSVTKQSALNFIALHTFYWNSYGTFILILPQHSWPLRTKFVLKFLEWCQSCLRPFHERKVFAKQRGIQRQQHRKHRPAERTILRLLHSQCFQSCCNLSLNYTTCKMQTLSRFLIATYKQHS